MNSSRILIVDDDENTRRLIKFALGREGYEISEAESGMAALEYLKTNRPDLIILDIVMPDMDGYTLIKKIRNMQVLRNIPVIMSSGKGGMKDYFELEEERFRPNNFLIKPYKMKDLLETVKNTI